MDKTIRKVTDPKRQQAETYRYWQSLPVGDRLTAVWEASVNAYAFNAHGVKYLVVGGYAEPRDDPQ